MQQIVRLCNQKKVKSYCTDCDENDGESPPNDLSDKSIFIGVMHVFPDDFVRLWRLEDLYFSLKVTEVFSDNLFREDVFLCKLKNHIFMHLSIQGDDSNFTLKFVLFNLLPEFVFEVTDFIFNCSNLGVDGFHGCF